MQDKQGMDPMSMAQDVGEKLTQLTGALSDMGVSPAVMKKMEQAMSLLGQVASEVGGGEAAEESGPIPAGKDQIPMEQGSKGVPLGPQIKN